MVLREPASYCVDDLVWMSPHVHDPALLSVDRHETAVVLQLSIVLPEGASEEQYSRSRRHTFIWPCVSQAHVALQKLNGKPPQSHGCRPVGSGIPGKSVMDPANGEDDRRMSKPGLGEMVSRIRSGFSSFDLAWIDLICSL